VLTLQQAQEHKEQEWLKKEKHLSVQVRHIAALLSSSAVQHAADSQREAERHRVREWERDTERHDERLRSSRYPPSLRLLPLLRFPCLLRFPPLLRSFSLSISLPPPTLSRVRVRVRALSESLSVSLGLSQPLPLSRSLALFRSRSLACSLSLHPSLCLSFALAPSLSLWLSLSLSKRSLAHSVLVLLSLTHTHMHADTHVHMPWVWYGWVYRDLDTLNSVCGRQQEEVQEALEQLQEQRMAVAELHTLCHTHHAHCKAVQHESGLLQDESAKSHRLLTERLQDCQLQRQREREHQKSLISALVAHVVVCQHLVAGSCLSSRTPAAPTPLAVYPTALPTLSLRPTPCFS